MFLARDVLGLQIKCAALKNDGGREGRQRTLLQVSGRRKYLNNFAEEADVCA